MTLEERQKRVNKELESRYGNVSLLRRLGGAGEVAVVSGLSSGSMILNRQISGSPLVGYAWGRIVEIYGPESSGKTTLALHAIFEAQRLEDATGEPVPCLFVDAEHALDMRYVRSIGIDPDRLSLEQPDFGELALEVVETAVKHGYKVIVVDSVAALTPKAEIDGEMGDSHMGLMARLMSQAMRKLNGVVSKNNAIVIFTNQIRLKLGVMFGNPETTPGGKALKFAASYRLEIRSPRSGAKSGKVKKLGEEDQDETLEVGTLANVKVVKNKLYPPYRKCSVYIEYGVGIDRYLDAVTFLEEAGAFRPSKNKSSSGKTSLVLDLPSRGKAYTKSKVLALFREDPKVQADILDHVRKIDGGGK